MNIPFPLRVFTVARDYISMPCYSLNLTDTMIGNICFSDRATTKNYKSELSSRDNNHSLCNAIAYLNNIVENLPWEKWSLPQKLSIKLKKEHLN